jgi:hypothetical protein
MIFIECEECKHYSYCKIKNSQRRDECIGHNDEAFKKDESRIFSMTWAEIERKQQKLG